MQVAVNSPGFKPTMSYQNFGSGENVNGFNGGLTVTHSSSISLSQNLGANLNFMRVYNSKTNPTDESVQTCLNHGFLGFGWKLILGRVYLRIDSLQSTSGSYVQRKVWIYEDETGTEHRLFLTSEFNNGIEGCGPSNSSLHPKDGKWYFTNDGSYIRAKFTENTSDYTLSYWTVYFPDGTKKILGNNGDSAINAYIAPVSINCSTVANGAVNGWYASKIIDRAGNEIKIYYNEYAPTSSSDPYAGKPYAGSIDYVVDQFERIVNFELTKDKPNNKLNNLLWKIIWPDGSIETFEYEVRNTTENGTNEMPFLIKVTDSVGLQTLYDYSGFWHYSPSGSSYFIGYYLYRIGYPTGATSEYEYDSFIYKYKDCSAPTDCQDEWGEFSGVVSHTEYVERGSNINNRAVWRWQRNFSSAKWIDNLSNQIALLPVLLTDPFGRKTLYFYANEWTSTQLVPPGMEVAVVKYNSNGVVWPLTENFNPFLNAVYVSRKKFSSNGGDADKCVAEYYEGNGGSYTPVGNVRVREVYESELDGSGNILWNRTTKNELYDGFGHYKLSYTEENSNSTRKKVLLNEYNLRKEYSEDIYQLDRITNSYSGIATSITFPQGYSTNQYAANYPGDPGEIKYVTITGDQNAQLGFKAVKMSYLDSAPLPDSGLLLQKSQKKAFVYEIQINNGDIDDVQIGTTDPTATIGYTASDKASDKGNISSIKYTGGQDSKNYEVNFTWNSGVVSSMRWDGVGYCEFTRGIDPYTSRITSETDANSFTTTFEYDSIGRITAIRPPNGEAHTIIEYPSSGGTGHIIKFYRGKNNSMPDATPSNGTVSGLGNEDIYTYYEFDDLGRLIMTSNVMPDGSWSSVEKCYDPLGNVVFESYPYRPGSSGMGTTSISIPVGTGSSYSITVPTKNNTAYGVFSTPFDSGSFSSPFSGTLDPFIRTRYVLKPDGGKTKNDYLGLETDVTIYGIKTGATTTTNATTKYYKDIFGRLLSVDAPEGADATYTYNGLDQLISADIGSQTRTFTYDALGHLLTSSTPERGTITYSGYDALGNLLSYTDNKGTIFANTYDAKGRLIQTQATTTVGDILRKWHYDKYNSEEFGSEQGKLVATENLDVPTKSVVEKFYYNGLNGRLSSKQSQIIGRTYRIDYEYDDFGNIISEDIYKIADGSSTRLIPTLPMNSEYSHGFLKSKTFSDGKGMEDSTYYPSGMQKTLTYGLEGITKEVAYAQQSEIPRLSSITAQTAEGGYWTTGSYQYDLASNIAKIGAVGSKNYADFSYDSLMRLVSANVTHYDKDKGNVDFSFAYNYDLYGNMTERKCTNSLEIQQKLGLTIANEFLAQTNIASGNIETTTNRLISFMRYGQTQATHISYDNNGNLIDDGSYSITYNPVNEIKSVQKKDGPINKNENYYYNADGERVATINLIDTSSIYLIKSGSLLLAEEKYSTSGTTFNVVRGKVYLYGPSGLIATEERENSATSQTLTTAISVICPRVLTERSYPLPKLSDPEVVSQNGQKYSLNLTITNISEPIIGAMVRIARIKDKGNDNDQGNGKKRSDEDKVQILYFLQEGYDADFVFKRYGLESGQSYGTVGALTPYSSTFLSFENLQTDKKYRITFSVWTSVGADPNLGFNLIDLEEGQVIVPKNYPQKKFSVKNLSKKDNDNETRGYMRAAWSDFGAVSYNLIGKDEAGNDILLNNEPIYGTEFEESFENLLVKGVSETTSVTLGFSIPSDEIIGPIGEKDKRLDVCRLPQPINIPPPPPKNISAITTNVEGQVKVILYWEAGASVAISGGIEYEVSRCKKPKNGACYLTGDGWTYLGTSFETRFIDTTASLNSLYFYKVRAININNGLSSDYVLFPNNLDGYYTEPVTAPNAPKVLNISTTENPKKTNLYFRYGLNLPNSGCTFEISRANLDNALSSCQNVSEGNYQLIGHTALGYYEDGSMASLIGSPYLSYRVRIVDEYGTPLTNWSPCSGMTLTNCDPKPSPVYGIVADVQPGKVILTWQSSCTNCEYWVYEGGDLIDGTVGLWQITTSKTATIYPTPNEHTISIVAVDNITRCVSEPSSKSFIAKAYCTTYPPTPQNLKAVKYPYTTATVFYRLTWSQSTGASTYHIYRSIGSGSPESIGTTTGTSFDDTNGGRGLPTGVAINYCVSAAFSNGCESPTSCATDNNDPTPNDPVGTATAKFYVEDHLGTVRVEMDTLGNVIATHDFEPYGVELPPTTPTANRLKYTGQERDNYTNYDYMHARFYASSMGRFLKPDNVVPDLTNPQNWNLYSYVNNNPVNFNDPSGHLGIRDYSTAGTDESGIGIDNGELPSLGGAYEDFPNEFLKPIKITLRVTIDKNITNEERKEVKEKFEEQLKDSNKVYNNIGIYLKANYKNGEVQDFEQAKQNVKRGEINVYLSKRVEWCVYDPGRSGISDEKAIIGLSQGKAEKSTLTHELGHVFGIRGPQWSHYFLIGAVSDAYIDYSTNILRTLGKSGFLFISPILPAYLRENAEKFQDFKE